MANNTRVLLVCILVAITLVVLVIAAIAIPVALVLSEDTSSESDDFKLHVNPADPIVMSVETSDGETIYMLGNKSSDGLPQSVDEFHIENVEGTTYVTMGSDGSIASAINTDGFQLDFIWGENFTTLHASIVAGNGSEQLSINIDLSESVDDNFTDFEEVDTNKRKRSAKSEMHVLQDNIYTQKGHEKSGQYMQQTKSSRMERQSESQNFANIAVLVESCSMPENNARVFADVLLDYDEDTGSFVDSTRYTAIKTQVPGEYNVRIPTSDASDIGDRAGMICDKIEMILGKVCSAYSKANDFVKLFSKHEADSVICFTLGNALKLAFPALRLVPVHRFCKTAFRGFKTYCNTANRDLGGGFTPANILCDALPLVDNGIDILQQENILFTASAFFSRGNTVTAPGRVFRISPGSSTVNGMVTVQNDQNKVRITRINVFPFDPAPLQDYDVIVSYECYSSIFVRMSIIGTDNYRDTVVCTTGPNCLLSVPGAEALVQDTVTVTAQDASTMIVRRIVIIF